jgi:hypothetical protein
MTLTGQLRSASERLRHACDLLLAPTPEALDDCSTILEGAVRHLAALQPALGAGNNSPETLAEARRLLGAVRRAGALLANAAEYHHRWQEWIGVRTSGYGPDGVPGETAHAARLCLRG